jgi:hypothetical protein
VPQLVSRKRKVSWRGAMRRMRRTGSGGVQIDVILHPKPN